MYGVLALWDHSLSPKETLTFCKPLTMFGVPKVLISDQGSHFYNRTMAMLLEKYGVARIHHYISSSNQRLPDSIRDVSLLDCFRQDLSFTGGDRAPSLLGDQEKQQLQELQKLRLKDYENSRIYKESVKHFHDSRILRKEFKVDQKVGRAFVVTNVFLYGIVEVRDATNNNTFK
ncbi:hypothetical protein CR513_19514, partial [Mucuna pruriens]